MQSSHVFPKKPGKLLAKLKKNTKQEHHGVLQEMLQKGSLGPSHFPDAAVETIKDYLECHPYRVDEIIKVDFGTGLGGLDGVIKGVLYEEEKLVVHQKSNPRIYQIVPYTSSKIKLPKAILTLSQAPAKRAKHLPSSANPRVFKVYHQPDRYQEFKTLRKLQEQYTGRISESFLVLAIPFSFCPDLATPHTHTDKALYEKVGADRLSLIDKRGWVWYNHLIVTDKNVTKRLYGPDWSPDPKLFK